MVLAQWKFFGTMMFLKGSDGVGPSISTLAAMDPKEYKKPAKKSENGEGKRV